MQLRIPISFTAIALAMSLATNGPAQDKAPDRPPEADKARRRDQREGDERPRREGEPRPEAGKAADGPEPRGRFGDGKGPPPGFKGEGPRGGFGGGEFGGGFVGPPPGDFGPGGMRGGSFGGGFSIRGYGGPEPEDPEMRDLIRKDSEMEHQTMELAVQIRRAKPEEREKLKKEISDLVTRHFDVRQERRKLQLKRMEEELKRLREAITKRDDSSESIVKNRIAELIGDPRELDF